MRYREIERRLATLEAPAQIGDLEDAGMAPLAWMHLAAWALRLVDAGGWDAIEGMAPGSTPYTCIGHLWVITHFWQRGTDRFLGAPRAEIALDVIVAAVEYVLSQGMSRAEITNWGMGREVWDAVWLACHQVKQPWD